MKHVTVQEAQAQLENLIDTAQVGETIEIVREGQVIARLQTVDPSIEKFDVAAIREFQATLKGPVVNTQDELDAWKNESRY